MISVRQGWFPVPNSILLKGTIPAMSSLRATWTALDGRSLEIASETPVMLLLVVMAVATCLYLGKASRAPAEDARWWQATIFLCVVLMHLPTAKVGWLYRYEAYLVVVGLAVTLPTALRLFPPLRPVRIDRAPWLVPAIALAGMIATPLIARGVKATAKTQMAMYDRYLEHVQPARFLRRYYPGATVMANDVGVLANDTECRLLDMYGLASREPVRFRHSKTGYTKEQVATWAASEGAGLAVLQVGWDEVSSRIPDSWIEVAEWKLPRNVVFGDKRVGFFATTAESAAALASNLRAFHAELPAEIQVTMQPPPLPRDAANP